MSAYVHLLSTGEPSFTKFLSKGTEWFRGDTCLMRSVDNLDLTDFLKSQQLTKPLPEVLFIGRSNVGKSSLLNALLKTNVADVSKQPV